MDIKPITKAFEYLKRNKVDIPLDLYLKGLKIGALKAGGSLGGINGTYHDAITQSIVNYFDGGSLVSSRNSFKRAVTDAFLNVFELGWTEAGGELPLDDEALSWLGVRIEQEFGHVEMLFENAKQLRKDSEFDYFTWATARADGYTSALQAVYNAAALFVAKKQMLTWQLGNTEKHCTTCSQLNGKRHPAYWYIANNYIPRQPGAAMECGGYNCDCSLVDRDGNEWTI